LRKRRNTIHYIRNRMSPRARFTVVYKQKTRGIYM
jgi:hypothetical protein